MVLIRIGVLFGLCFALTSATHKCGVRNVEGVGFLVYGQAEGHSEFGEFPWMVAIFKKVRVHDDDINVYECGGSLIHPSVVLTSARCLLNKTAEEMAVRVGEWDTQTKREVFEHQDRQVSEIIMHSSYDRSKYANSVALLFLSEPVELMETVDTICLPPVEQHIGLPRCFASGWGKDVAGEHGKYQVVLKKLFLPIVTRDKCQEKLRTTPLGREFVLHSSLICAGGEEGRNMCEGDAGSPLVCPIPGTVNRFYQAGIVVGGYGCGENEVPVLYTNVALFREWIEGQLTQRKIVHSYFNYS
uniref:Phenoloxidase-activating factor 2 n=1 Tax=Anopheles atroparvus TaxID=41427 RepID=A0A182IX49_ANOAO